MEENLVANALASESLKKTLDFTFLENVVASTGICDLHYELEFNLKATFFLSKKQVTN